MDIYAEACHTTAILYQSAICLPKVMHIATCCLVAPMNPPVLSSPKPLRNFMWKAKRSWVLFGCSWGNDLLWLLLLLLALGCLLENSTYYTGDSHNLVFKNTSQMQRSKGFQKTPETVLAAQLFQAVFSALMNWGAQRAKVKLFDCGRWPWASFCSTRSDGSTASGAFLKLPCPSRLRMFVPLCPSSCWGVWPFTMLLLLGQAETTIKSIKIWITSNRPDTNTVKNRYLLATVHSRS